MLQMQDSTLLTQNARYITTAQQDSATPNKIPREKF